MKRIMIIGSSIAAAETIENIRARDKESAITAFFPEGCLPYRRDLFPDFLAKALKEEQVLYKPKEFYEQHRVTVETAAAINRINFKKKRLTTEDKQQHDFDVCVLTDTPAVKFPAIKGTKKTGVFSFMRFKDIRAIVEVLPIVETIIILTNSLAGINTAHALRKRGKEVIVVTPGEHILADILDRGTALFIQRSLEEKGMRFIFNEGISEILGDSHLKAVRLKNGKVIAAQLVLLDDQGPDLKWLADTGLVINKRISVNERFQTNFEDVFAVDRTCENKEEAVVNGFDLSLTTLKEQGKAVGLAIAGQEVTLRPLFPVGSLNIEGLLVTVLGRAKEIPGKEEYHTSSAENNVYKKIFADQGILTGAVLINAEDQKEKLLRLMEEKVNIAQMMERVLDESVAFDQLVGDRPG